MKTWIVSSSDDVNVLINPLELDFYEFIGSRAALEAEGIDFQGQDWPTGFNSVSWTAGRFKYKIRRIRPKNAKGPRRQFVDVDWWCFRCELVESIHPFEKAIREKEKELEAARRRATKIGREEWSTFCNRYRAMEADEAFLGFMGRVLGKGPLFPPRHESGGLAS